jgi:hypothetical protein
MPRLDEIAARVLESGVAEQISRGHEQRILLLGGVRGPAMAAVRTRPFPEKVNVICRPHRWAPRNGFFSIDEKTDMHAVERKHPGQSPAPGWLRRRECEYIRHGTQAFIAALGVHSGKVLTECRERRTQDDLAALMERVAAAYPGKQVHVERAAFHVA